MTPQVKLIIDTVRASLSGTDDCVDQMEDEDLAHLLFMTYRANPSYGFGMRLSAEGMHRLKKCFDFFVLDLDEAYSSRDLIFMNRFCPFPYHLWHKEITIFDRRWATRIRLYGRLSALRDSMT